jgi:hypothetical protein
MKKFINKVAIVSLALFLILAPTTMAIEGPENPLPGEGGLDLGTISDWIENVAQFLITIGMIIAVIFIIWGGILYMSAGDNETRSKSGKAYMINGIIGAAVILAIGLILSTIQNLVSGEGTFFNF